MQRYTPTPTTTGPSTSSRLHKSSDNLLSLYNRIPDYSEVKHLGQSEFIKALEQLKEEFRQCRASLYNEESNNDSDYDQLVSRTSKVLNINSCSSSKKISNTNLSIFGQSGRERATDSNSELTKDYLSVKGCQLYRVPSASGAGGTISAPYVNYNKPSRSLSFDFESLKNNPGTDSAFHDGYDDELESGGNSDGSDDSKWSSSPDLRAYKEFVPPTNVEKRLLERKSQNNSAPSLTLAEDEKPTHFKANPVPSHVYKPLYEFIMLKNQRRSQKVREQSKQKLIAQVKPFSFTRELKSAGHANSQKPITNSERAQIQSQSAKEVLNNTKPIKSRRGCTSGHTTNNFKTVNHFRANPAPPRTKALLSAMRLKEQQEYRELKKRLRAEALLKNATLPPSMAARDKRLKFYNAKLDALIQEYQNSYNSVKDNRNNSYREHSTDLETAYTDEDRLSEDSYQCLNSPANLNTTPVSRARRPKNFTPYGKSRHSSAASGIFECTSNDNLASRLRIQATRKREAERMKREEEELLKLMRNENRRKKLRDSHIQAWRRAHSYSSNQDIAMRRQLRMAASILERESFVRDMSSMLSRVRSAPLLLEGVRERKSEPCKKHKEEFGQGDRFNNKSSTPRFTFTRGTSNWMLFDRFGDDRSETIALAEGTLTNSDNESVGSIASDSDNDDDGDDDGGGANSEIGIRKTKQLSFKTGDGDGNKHKSKDENEADDTGDNQGE